MAGTWLCALRNGLAFVADCDRKFLLDIPQIRSDMVSIDHRYLSMTTRARVCYRPSSHVYAGCFFPNFSLSSSVDVLLGPQKIGCMLRTTTQSWHVSAYETHNASTANLCSVSSVTACTSL